MSNTERQNPFLFDVGEMLGDSEYQVIHAEGASVPEGRARHVDAGGAGVVYRTLYKGLMPRAVKLLAPRPDLLLKIERGAFEETFEAEIALLARVTHTRLAKIVDYGRITIAPDKVEDYDDYVSTDGDFLYYAMDYIDGQHLDKAFLQPGFGGSDFLALMDEVLDAVEYLHGLDIMHADLKEENILVRVAGGKFSATVVDLGVAKRMKPTEEGEQEAQIELAAPAEDSIEIDFESSLTLFFSSWKIVREEWRQLLKHPITRKELNALFPGHDLYALGRLVELALENEGILGRLEQDLGASGLQALLSVRNRLKAPLAEPQYYQTIEQLRNDWRKLQPGYLAPLNIPELAVGSSAMTSVPIPSGRVSLTRRALSAINHPLVQRLRHIPQLEFASLVYPGATHTRLLHALSTFDTTRRFISHLMNDPNFRLMVEPVEIEATLLRALLHDIGHYPLSHMFEDFAEEEKSRGEPRRVPTDDDLFWSFVDVQRSTTGFEEYAAVIESELALHANSTVRPLREHLVQEAGFSPQAVDGMSSLDLPQRPSQSVLAAVLSSPIDVDKVSYLYDDSDASGVRYGLGMDLDALLPSLRAPRVEDVVDGEPLLAITDKGLPAAEGIVLARYWMLKRVYWHHTNRAIMAMVKFVIQELLRARRLTMPEYVRRHLFAGSWEALAYLSGRFDELAVEHEVDARRLRNPLPGMMGGNRVLYKRIVTTARGPLSGDADLYDRLAFKTPADLDDLVGRAHETLEEVLGPDAQILRGDLIIDVPTKRREQLGGPVVVYLQDRDRAQSLEEASPLLRELRDEFDQHVKKCRVFIHPRIADQLREQGRIQAAREQLTRTLRQRVGL
jgi:HD superfamily phosphohydrolase